MSISLGLDTSNYTTSAALYDSENNLVVQRKKLLPVKEGELGLRQSDAVFHHVRQLPEIMTELFEDWKQSHGEQLPKIEMIGVSTRPRPIEGSYMPCFEVGRSTAEQLSAVLGIPVLPFSHQEGHIAAAIYSSGLKVSEGDRFLALHLSGGTTEIVEAVACRGGFEVNYISGSLDLKAGQLIDRVAGMLGLPFPGGVHLDKLALECEDSIKCRPTLRGADCCLSGVENICKKLLAEGAQPSYIAKTCLEYITAAIEGMLKVICAERGEMPVLFAGGVSSNTLLRERMKKSFDAYFAAPQFSCDNAAGTAILAAKGVHI